MRLLVKGRIFARGELLEGSVLIEDGRIARVAREIREPADEVLDYMGRGFLVLPGFIDMHVHLRDFELGYKEDVSSGTAAAAMGGFTVVADMPNTIPRVNTPEVLEEREHLAKRKALVDYGIYYGVPDRDAHLTDEIEALAIGFKVFMPEEFYTEKRWLVEKTLEYAARKRMLVVAHAEDPRFFTKTWIGEAGTPEAEASAIRDFAGRALASGFRPHVTHLSSAAGVKESLGWKEKVKLTTDTCPHYLLLSDTDARLLGPIAKIKPSIKSSGDSRFLLERLKDGSIDALTSDHSPHSLEEKADPVKALHGFPGLETTLPLLLTMVDEGSLSLADLVRVCSTNPAKILGLSLAGSIEEGKVGNLTIIDLHRRGKIDSGSFMSKAKYSPFEGREVKGMPVTTIVRGQLVMLDRELVAPEGGATNVKAYG